VQTIRKQIRALKLSMETRLKKTLGNQVAILKWLPRHASWLYNRFNVRENGLTAYEKTHLLKYQRPLVEMGEAVICRRPGAQLNKLEMMWLEGVYIGRDARTDEHLIGTPGGVCRSRAVKRKVEHRRWDQTLIDQMRWTPLGTDSSDTRTTTNPTFGTRTHLVGTPTKVGGGDTASTTKSDDDTRERDGDDRRRTRTTTDRYERTTREQEKETGSVHSS